MFKSVTLLVILLFAIKVIKGDLQLSAKTLEVAIGERATFNFTISSTSRNFSREEIRLLTKNARVVFVTPNRFQYFTGRKNVNNATYTVEVDGLTCGKSEIYVVARNKSVYLLVNVYKSKCLATLSEVLKWIFVVAWSVCYYPQVYTNFRRKSVVGLNFDYVMFGTYGYCVYTLFNFGLYFIPSIKDMYLKDNTESVMPVQPCDIISTAHNMILSATIASQCFIYEKGEQKVSLKALVIVLSFSIGIGITAILAAFKVIIWLHVLYGCSYVKFSISLLLYTPQLYMNYKRKSTSGWSVGGALLDLTGAMSSSLQMLIDSYNYGTWEVIIHNVSKFGIGLVSILFTAALITQHAVCYRTAPVEIEKEMKIPTQTNILRY